MGEIRTDRLIIRPPAKRDRARFVELFTNEAFTVFSDGVHDVESANTRFDLMLLLAEAVPYAKQPVIECTSGIIVGYTGVGSVLLDGVNRLEWGWRLVPEARGQGYATEATTALLSLADRVDDGEMLCLVDVDNHPFETRRRQGRVQLVAAQRMARRSERRHGRLDSPDRLRRFSTHCPRASVTHLCRDLPGPTRCADRDASAPAGMGYSAGALSMPGRMAATSAQFEAAVVYGH